MLTIERGHILRPKISIIVPIYNVQDYLDELMRSLLEQTIGFEQLEVLLIDDGSTDESRGVIKRWVNQFENVKGIYFDIASGAAGRPRNAGLAQASGEYILFADPDDVLQLTGCEALYEQATRYSSDVVVGMFETFLSTGVYVHDIYKNELAKPKSQFTIEQFPIVLNAPVNLMCKLFKTSFLKEQELVFLEGVAAQDNPFSTEAFLAAKSITYTPTVIYKYRIRESHSNLSITQQRTLKYFKDFSTVRQEVVKIYKKYNQLSYLQTRYYADLNWLINQLFLGPVYTHAEIAAILKEVEWFVHLSEQANTAALTEEKVLLLQAMVGRNIPAVLNILHVQQQLMKERFKKSFH